MDTTNTPSADDAPTNATATTSTTKTSGKPPAKLVPLTFTLGMSVLITLLCLVAAVLYTLPDFVGLWSMFAKSLLIYLVAMPAGFMLGARVWQAVDASVHFAPRNVYSLAVLVALTMILWQMGSYS